MIGTEKPNNEIMRMNAASMICDKNQEFKFESFSKERLKLCLYENMKTGVKCGLKHNEIHDSAKLNKGKDHLEKNRSCPIHEY